VVCSFLWKINHARGIPSAVQFTTWNLKLLLQHNPWVELRAHDVFLTQGVHFLLQNKHQMKHKKMSYLLNIRPVKCFVGYIGGLIQPKALFIFYMFVFIKASPYMFWSEDGQNLTETCRVKLWWTRTFKSYQVLFYVQCKWQHKEVGSAFSSPPLIIQTIIVKLRRNSLKLYLGMSVNLIFSTHT
jgi:hypothetical protein